MTSSPRSIARRLAIAAALAFVIGAAAAPAFALPVMDMHIEDLMPMGPDIRKSLNLNANQELLWQQVESKTRQLMRERMSRRERLQSATKLGLAGARVELRDLAGAIDAETAASAAEEKQMRELWLTVNDALTETQRQAVATFFAEQMQRVPDAGPQHGAERGKDDGGGRSRGGRQKPGGGMGMPGS